MAAVVLYRGLVLLIAPLVQLTPFAILGTGLAALMPALLVLLWLRSSGDARRCFAVAIVASVLGALADALTPSYDASPLWSWIGDGLQLAAELATLGGFAFLAERARAALLLLGLGTLLSLSRLVLPDVLAIRIAAPALLALGHFLLFPSLRQKSTNVRAFFEDGLLFRWSLVEVGRFVVLGGALLMAVVFNARDRGTILLGSFAIAICAVLAALGARRRAVPLAGVVVTLTILPELAEALIAGREAALERAAVKAVVAAMLIPVGVWTLARATPRRGWPLGIASWSLPVVPLLLLLVAILQEFVSWDARRSLEQTVPFLLIAFGVAWLASVLISAVKLRAHRAPGGVGDHVANTA